MSANNRPIHHVKTNIITGFLGVGKTTVIKHLISKRSHGERWAVLVNEFGEMGIDGHMLESNSNAITVKQVPGGCICCAAGLPLQVAVNQLLKQARPDRLIIEPSGMGHPRNILKSLGEAHYADVLDMHACLCLLDPRNLQDSRYLESELFIDQIDVADIIVANKTDLASRDVKMYFKQFFKNRYRNKTIIWNKPGYDLLKTLNQKHNAQNRPATGNLNNKLESAYNKLTLDFELDTVFAYEKLHNVLSGMEAERVKGILNTSKGFIRINNVSTDINIGFTKNSRINRIEIITTGKHDKQALCECFNALKL